MEDNRRYQLGVTASGGGGGENQSQDHLRGAVVSGGGGESGGQGPLRGAVASGGGENGGQEPLRGAVASGGGENGGQEPLRGSIVGDRPAQSVDAAVGDVMRVVAAAACAVGVIPSAPKRKRGRPKGSKKK
ncbi:hypothetical protein PC129_g23635 [Phytophthora cactorum]|uniref:Uncharacterized protein n=1 Tax=Phytophthora cactorum TaxID=29920 RepID=A0A8T1LDB7_9STRA|nr:hypothetical protein Pcac1_g10875 [Phytophthora cactorum]KAG2826491.1 hypothetical protein PC112_g9256 [Phytophthora cactorum]KAG2828908.1 hypothetical protein PC111_g7975 [Phytophthora cactorum]KAG2866352.1 hypothetical protein PC113_g2881 [Phytophthora cactorum]KAG2928702.1 hypothetical protein PC114_g2980 [Phytophthora cactorum]